jgi:hypothetical protein
MEPSTIYCSNISAIGAYVRSSTSVWVYCHYHLPKATSERRTLRLSRISQMLELVLTTPGPVRPTSVMTVFRHFLYAAHHDSLVHSLLLSAI